MNILKNIWLFFADSNFGFGTPVYDLATPKERERNPYVYPLNPKAPHIHDWIYSSAFKHEWRIHNGRPVGTRYQIDEVIAAIKERPGHTETLPSMVDGWKATGYTFVHASWTIWKCRICGETKHTEYYTAPIKTDGSGPVLYDTTIIPNNNVYKETVVVGRREYAVEKVKKYS
jgi:hypothetical protein